MNIVHKLYMNLLDVSCAYLDIKNDYLSPASLFCKLSKLIPEYTKSLPLITV
jgi:hypothetical protein